MPKHILQNRKRNWQPVKPAVSNLSKEISWFIADKYLWIVFLCRGCYWGNQAFRWQRIFCLFNKHTWRDYVFTNEDHVPTPEVIWGHVQCEYCGCASKKEVFNQVIIGVDEIKKGKWIT